MSSRTLPTEIMLIITEHYFHTIINTYLDKPFASRDLQDMESFTMRAFE